MSRSRESVRYAAFDCGLGVAVVAVRDGRICAIELGDDASALADSLERRFHSDGVHVVDVDSDPLIGRVAAALDTCTGFSELPLDSGGTSFQQLVWSYLRTIPVGETRSYAQVAEAIGRPLASRAVATACASNRIAVAIPCHRVVRSDGALSGYRWGAERKRTLLDRERAVATGR